MYQTDQYEGMIAETVTMRGHNGDLINAYIARPLGAGPFPGMVVIHHAPGWDEWYRECTRRFAHHGYVSISPNLYFRDGHGSPEDVGAKVRAAGGAPDARVLGDLEGANAYLRSLPYVSGKIGVFGTCSGGRQAFLAGCRLKGFDAVIDCWGGRVVQSKEELTPNQPVAPIDYTKDLSCPAARAVRQRGQGPHARAGRPAGGGAQEARQAVRVPPLRRGRPRLLLLRPRGVPAGAGRRRLEEGVRLLRANASVGAAEASRVCTMIAHQVKLEGRGKQGPEWFEVREANVSYDHPYDLPLEHALNIDFVNEALGPGARVAVELSVDAARRLVKTIEAVLAQADRQGVLEDRSLAAPTPLAPSA